jgi:hypothetical protein
MTRSSIWGGRRHASAIRLTVLAIWAITVASTPYSAYASFSPEIVAGFGVGRVILASDLVTHYLFTTPVLAGLRFIALLGCVVAMVTPWRGTLVTSFVFVILLTLDAISKSLGVFANHAQVVPLLVLGVFACFGSRSYMTIRELVQRQGLDRQQTLGLNGRQGVRTFSGMTWLVAIMIILPYSYIGIQRLTSSGLAFFVGDSLDQYLSAASRSYQSYPSWFDPVVMKSLLNAGFFGITVLEATSGFLLVSRTYRSIWLIGIVTFQLSTLFLMNVFFWENLLLAVVTFWPGWRSGTSLGRNER